jgi:DNA-binding transcriptional MerR regulator
VIGNDDRRWSIGELARATGTTVRALRHYDEIGLLSAGERTTAGHRRYTGADVWRLYRIRALRGLGLSLEEVARALGEADVASLRELLVAQLRGLEVHAETVRRLSGRLHGLLDRLDDAGGPDPAEFMTTLEMMSMFETYFTPEQRATLAERRAELGDEAIDDAKREFRDLVAEGFGLLDDGTPPDDPRARALVERWDAVGERFHSEEGTKTAARAAWSDNSAEIAGRTPWPAERLIELVSYLDRVRAAR